MKAGSDSSLNVVFIFLVKKPINSKILFYFISVVWAPACLFWPRLIKQLGPFLNWSGVGEPSSLSWRDDAVREALQKRYLATQEQRKWAHGILARYYEGKLDSGIDAEALSGRVAHSDEHRRSV